MTVWRERRNIGNSFIAAEAWCGTWRSDLFSESLSSSELDDAIADSTELEEPTIFPEGEVIAMFICNILFFDLHALVFVLLIGKASFDFFGSIVLIRDGLKQLQTATLI